MAIPDKRIFSWAPWQEEMLKRTLAEKPKSLFEKFLMEEPMADEKDLARKTMPRSMHSRRMHTDMTAELSSWKRRFPDLWHHTMRQSRDAHEHHRRMQHEIQKREIERNARADMPFSSKPFFDPSEIDRIQGMRPDMFIMDDPATKKPACHPMDEKLLLLLPTP